MISVDYLYFGDPRNRDFSVGADLYTQKMRNFTHLGFLPRAFDCGY